MGVQSDDEGLVMIVTPDQWEFSDFPVVGAVDTVCSKLSLPSVYVYPLRYVSVNVSGYECVALEDSGCQIPIVSERMFEWCCGKAVGKVTLHGFGRSHTVQSPLVNVAVRVRDNECAEVGEISLVCAVTDLYAVEYDMILPADVVYKLKAIPVTSKVSCCDASVVTGERSEIPKVVTEEGTPEEVNESVAGVEVCVTGRDVKDVVRIDDVLTSTPARVSCIVSSARSEETKTIQVHPEPRLESILPLVEVSDRVDGCSGRRDAEVRRIQEMADLGPRRTRSRGSQDVTAADKSEVGRAICGPRGSGRVRPSDSSTTSPVARIVLVMLWQVLYLARAGTLLPNRNRVCYPRDNRAAFLSRQERNRVSAGISCDSPYWTENPRTVYVLCIWLLYCIPIVFICIFVILCQDSSQYLYLN